MKKLFLPLLLFVVPFYVYGQKIFYKSSEIHHEVNSQKSIQSIELRFLNPTILNVVYCDQTIDKIKGEDIWGYENEFHQIFRFNIKKDHFYLLKEEGAICIYLSQDDHHLTRFKQYFFSKGLEGIMYRANDKNVRQYLSPEEQSLLKKGFK